MIPGVLRRLLYIGRSQVRDYEHEILCAFRSLLNAEESETLDYHLSNLFVQRQAGDAKVCFYAKDAQKIMPKFGNRERGKLAAKIFFSPKTRECDITVKIYIHLGILFSIEFPKRPMRLTELYGGTISQWIVSSAHLTSDWRIN